MRALVLTDRSRSGRLNGSSGSPWTPEKLDNARLEAKLQVDVLPML
jgi:hypothetical protein